MERPAGSFFVSFEAVAIVLRVVSGISLYTLAWDDGTYDHHDDILLYQRADTSFSVNLHRAARSLR